MNMPLDAAKLSPPLENGDHLELAEFRARYTHRPDVKKAELIHGVVHVPSPVNLEFHGEPDIILAYLLMHYTLATPGVQAGSNTTARFGLKNDEPQPDLLLRIRPEFGGQSGSDQGWLTGAPELIVEIAASSASYDLHDKKDVYEANGVQEYLVWRIFDQAFDAFELRVRTFEPKAFTPEGCFQSKTFPGLWIDCRALASRDIAQALHTLNQGIASHEHQDFVRSLKSRYLPPGSSSSPPA